MLKTIDDKIDQLKHEGIVNLPRQNTLENLPIIENIIFETRPYKLFAEDVDKVEVLEEWGNDGGCRTYNA